MFFYRASQRGKEAYFFKAVQNYSNNLEYTNIQYNFAKNLPIMEKKELLKLFKYYKEEEKNPFTPGSLPAKWWEGEKMLLGLVADDKNAWERIVNHLKSAIEGGHASHHLVDKNISIEQRAIYYYLDMWNGKNYPYDSLDDIFDYVKAE